MFNFVEKREMLEILEYGAVNILRRLSANARILLRRVSYGAISDVSLWLANEVCAKTRAGVCESPLKFHSAVWAADNKLPHGSRRNLPSTAARATYTPSTHTRPSVPVNVHDMYGTTRSMSRKYGRTPWAELIQLALTPTSCRPESSILSVRALPPIITTYLTRNLPCARHVCKTTPRIACCCISVRQFRWALSFCARYRISK